MEEVTTVIGLLDKHFALTITTFATLSAVALTGSLTFYVEKRKMKLAEKEKAYEFKKQKLEEVYEYFNRLSKYLTLKSFFFMNFHLNIIDEHLMHKKIEEIEDKIRPKNTMTDTLEMLVNLYFPDLQEMYNEIQSDYEKIIALQDVLIGDKGSEYKSLHNSFDKKCNCFRNDIVNLSKKYQTSSP